MKLRILPLIISAVVIAAHFLRSYSLVPMLMCLAAPALLLVKRYWSLLALQVLSVASALIWLWALYDIIQQRIFEGRSWIASAVILVSVALFTLYSGWLLNTPQVKRHYPA